jgi:hypothetical protein
MANRGFGTLQADPDSARREHARSPLDAFRSPEGAYFKRFSFERHVKQITIVPNWQTWREIDFGLRHPACLWAQRSPKGQLFIVDELLPENVTTPEFAAQIKAREATYGLVEPPLESFCDPAGKAANTQTAESEFDNFAREGLCPKGKSSAVRDGCMLIMNLLAVEELPLLVSDRCEGLIRALSQVKPHTSRHETYDTDHQIFSHPLDALRYLLINLPADWSDWPTIDYGWDPMPRMWQVRRAASVGGCGAARNRGDGVAVCVDRLGG